MDKKTISKKDVKQITEESKNNVEKKKENKLIFELLKKIKSIINFSNENKIFLIYFTNNFW